MAHYPGCFGNKITKSSAFLDYEQYWLRKKDLRIRLTNKHRIRTLRLSQLSG